MHFASHLRSERLGEFTVGTECIALSRRRSSRAPQRRHVAHAHLPAIVQVLVLYHLVTARATVALGGEATRTDQPAAEGRAPASAAP